MKRRRVYPEVPQIGSVKTEFFRSRATVKELKAINCILAFLERLRCVLVLKIFPNSFGRQVSWASMTGNPPAEAQLEAHQREPQRLTETLSESC